jgi:Fur family ferric uptake transcriptional regulator
MGPDMMTKFEEFLQEKGLRLTAQRELIARTFFRNKGHISTEEIYRQVQRSAPKIGSATTYRTMKLLAESGLASLRSFGDGFSRYEPSAKSDHHDHLICTKCGTIIEFENAQIEALQKSVAKKHGFTVTDHKLEMYGYCRKCRG